MPQISLRLDDPDHKLLQTIATLTGRSQNQIIIDLVRAEIDRVLPGKREQLHSDPDALWKALGVPVPQPGPMAKRWSGELMDKLADDGGQGELMDKLADDGGQGELMDKLADDGGQGELAPRRRAA